MVAKPIAPARPAASAPPPERIWVDGDPTPSPLRLDFRPALKLLAKLGYAERDVDQWLLEFNKANRDLVGKLELNTEGMLLVSPMQSKAGAGDEAETLTDLNNWSRDYGGRAYGSRLGVRLPSGQRYAPDAAWLTPEQERDANRILQDSDDWLLPFCPAFVVEILSRNDSVAAAQRKMAEYIANGALLGWLIDRFRRRVHIYRPGVPPEVLDDPETVSGDPELPGFVFAVRRRIFDMR